MENNNWAGGNYPNPYDPWNGDFRSSEQNAGEMQGATQQMPPQYAAPSANTPYPNAPQEYNPYAAPMAQDYGAYANQPAQPYAPNGGYYAPQSNYAPQPNYAPQSNYAPQPNYAPQSNYAPDNGAYPNQPVQAYPEYAPGNAYYAQQTATPNYASYSNAQQGNKKNNKTLFALVTIMSICFVAIAALCIYFIAGADGDEPSKTKEPSSEYHSRETTAPTEDKDLPTEEEPTPDATQTAPTEPPTTEPPTTEPPTTVSTPEDPYLYLDELNRKHGNYFDFLPDENGHVLAHSSTRLISRQELYGMTEHEVCMARNELYARHGYIFQTEKYNEYFQSFDWYHPTTTTLPTLNEIESENAKLIAAYEEEHGW